MFIKNCDVFSKHIVWVRCRKPSKTFLVILGLFKSTLGPHFCTEEIYLAIDIDACQTYVWCNCIATANVVPI